MFEVKKNDVEKTEYLRLNIRNDNFTSDFFSCLQKDIQRTLANWQLFTQKKPM